MTKHILSEEDFEKKRAFCSAHQAVVKMHRKKKDQRYYCNGLVLKDKHVISNPIEETRTGNCSICGPDVAIAKHATYVIGWCCQSIRDNTRRLRNGAGHGLSRIQSAKLLSEAGNKCQNPKCDNVVDLKIDHAHATGVVRGILCHGCNVSLGFLRENVDVILGLASYIANPPFPTIENLYEGDRLAANLWKEARATGGGQQIDEELVLTADEPDPKDFE